MLKAPITHEELENFLNEHALEKPPERKTRVITVTISGPEAGSITAEISSTLARVAQAIESRVPNMIVKIAVTPIDSAPADTTAKAKT